MRSMKEPGFDGGGSRPIGGRPSPRRWLFAALRRRHLFRLISHRRALGVAIETKPTLIVGCDCLADLEGWPVPPSLAPHLGLHPVNVRQMAQDLALSIDDTFIADVTEIVCSFRRRGGNLSSDEVGRWLSLTRAEREAVRAWSMDAAEEPAEARKVRKAAEKSLRDRDRQRAKRAADREAKGLPPFDPGQTLKAMAPWLALGISERTWHRRQSAVRLMDGSNASPAFVPLSAGSKQSQTSVADGSGSNASPTFSMKTDPRRLTAAPRAC